MKHTALFCAIVMILCSASAQKFAPEFSPGFEEPNALESKVIQCSNGNTFLFSFTKKDGIAIMLFDKARQVVAKKTIKGKEWKTDEMTASRIAGIHEIRGQINMFMEQVVGKVPRLYRLVFDANTGDQISEQKMAEMPKYGSFSGYSMLFGGVEPKGFFVVKDAASDNYAVVNFDGFAEETDRRMEIIHYNGEHKEISRAFFNSPDNQYKYVNFLDMYVDGAKQVVVCTYAFNTQGGKSSKVFMSKLEAGKNSVEHFPLRITADFKSTRGILAYNAGTKNIELLAVSLVQKENNNTIYNSTIAAFDPVTSDVVFAKPLNASKTSEYRKANYAQSGSYTGMPMNMIVNPDYSTTIVMEELGQKDVYRDNGSLSSRTYLLKDIGVLDLDERLEPKYGYSIRKSQISSFPVPPLSLHDKANNCVSFDKNMMNMFGLGGMYTKSGYFSSDYLAGAHGGRYIIFNDLPENFKLDSKTAPKDMNVISNCNTVCYQMKDGTIERSYLFGPFDGFDNSFALLSSSHYQQSSNTYAVMMLKKDHGVKKAHVAWIKLD